jgi:3'-5' exoribonuclease
VIEKTLQAGLRLEPKLLTISELQVKATAFGWLLVTETQTKLAKSGKLFRQLKLRDQKGNSITAYQFDLSRVETLIPEAGKVALLEGTVDEFNNEMVLKLSRAQIDEAVSPDLFLLGTRRSISAIEEQFRELFGKVQHPGLYEVLHRCFSPEVLACFRRWPAAVRHHGAVKGGLIEHTVNVTLIAEKLAQLYASDMSMVIAGALLHDIGKLEELEEEIGIGLTPRGRMFGHVILGANYVQAHTEPILDEVTANDLVHIILAHHGSKEFGSPVSPVTLEAWIVHLADMTEAKMTGFLDHCERTANADGWSAYSTVFGSQLRVP